MEFQKMTECAEMKSDNMTNDGSRVAWTVVVTEPQSVPESDGGDEKHSDVSDTDHDRTMSMTSNTADSGISVGSDMRDEHVSADESTLRHPGQRSSRTKPRFSLDILRRPKMPGKRSMNAHKRRSCSLPDILDISMYTDKKGDGLNNCASDTDFSRPAVCENERIGNGTSRGRQISLPICGKTHAEEPCYICLKDNEIYCKVCVQLHNFHCPENVKFIPEMAPEMKSSMRSEVTRELSSIKMRFERIKNENLQNIEKLKSAKCDYIQSVSCVKRTLVQIIDTIEKEALEEMETAYQQETSIIESNLTKIEAEIKKTEECINDIQSEDDSDSVSMVFRMQEATKYVRFHESTVHEIHKYSNAVTFNFEPLSELQMLMAESKKPWRLQKEETGCCQVPQSCICEKPYRYRHAFNGREVNVHLNGWSSDTKKCSISGCEFLPNGNLLLCDNTNKKVKLFDRRYKCTSVQTLPSQPWDITIVDNDVAVVTLPERKQLQFVSANSRLALKHSISVVKHCWGIAHSDGLLYVTCWSRDSSEVLVLDMQGVPKRMIDTVEGKCFHTPWFLTAVNDLVYVSDWGTYDVQCVTTSGTRLQDYRHRALVGPLGVTSDPDGNIYVCGRDSNNVHQLLPDGTLQQILLSEKDGIVQPMNICYCPFDDRLVVTSLMSDKIHVFTLH